MNTNENEPMHPSETAMARYHGLTKREYFAGLAMQGLCARNDGELSHNRAAYAVEHADDLLAALEKSK
jgi:hypothetical protein